MEDDIAKTEYDLYENPAMFTTDELTIARTISNYRNGLKLHQLVNENHNIVFQNNSVNSVIQTVSQSSRASISRPITQKCLISSKKI